MKKAGFVLIPLGVLLIVLAIVGIEKTEAKEPLPFFILLFGLIFTFLGLSFLFFGLPYEKRKKRANLLIIIGLSAVGLLVLSVFFKMKIPGIDIMLTCISFYLSFTCLPLLTKNRVEKWKKFTRKTWHAFLLSVGDLISISALILGYLFKIMHWPGATAMMRIGMVILAISLISWNRLFSKEIVLRKQAEDKANDAFTQLKEQHEIIEEKNKEILDSIRYAQRIQNSLLPTEKYIDVRLNKLNKN